MYSVDIQYAFAVSFKHDSSCILAKLCKHNLQTLDVYFLMTAMHVFCEGDTFLKKKMRKTIKKTNNLWRLLETKKLPIRQSYWLEKG